MTAFSDSEQRAILAALFAPEEGQSPDTASLDPGQFSGLWRFVARDLHGGRSLDDVWLDLDSSSQAALLAARPGAETAPQERDMYDHDDLLAAEFKPLSWVIDGLVVADGLTWLGGKKKLGKSLLALNAAWAVAGGGVLLGRQCQQGRVVYLCLEDGRRRLQDRLRKQDAPAGLPITYVFRFRPLDAGGMDDLRALILEKKPSLLILDTLASAKTGRLDENDAGAMGDLANALHLLAQDYGVAVLIIVHHGKMATGDPGFDIRGSSAQSGASDVNLGLYRNEDGAVTLKTEGRDLEGEEIRIALDKPTLTWALVGDARKLARQDADDGVRGVLMTLGEADAGAVARECGRERSWVARQLKRLERDGAVSSRAIKDGKTSKIVYKVIK